CRTFGDLHDLIAGARTPGVGRLTVYDTSLRIGAHLGLGPQEVYLHAGAAAGATALGLRGKRGRLAMEQLPFPLRRLSADEVEDCLCIYKAWLRGRSLPRARRVGCGPRRFGPGVC